MHTYWSNYAGSFVPGVMAGWLSILVFPLMIWSLVWMAIALWKAARDGSKAWFIVLLCVHTLGILDILYIFVFSKMNESKPKKVSKK